jgi:hypothetical protein
MPFFFEYMFKMYAPYGYKFILFLFQMTTPAEIPHSRSPEMSTTWKLTSLMKTVRRNINIVTDLIDALPGNSSVNTG